MAFHSINLGRYGMNNIQQCANLLSLNEMNLTMLQSFFNALYLVRILSLSSSTDQYLSQIFWGGSGSTVHKIVHSALNCNVKEML